MSGQNSIGEPTRYRDTVTGKEVWWSRSKHSYVTAARKRVRRSNVQQRPQTPSTQQTEPETSQEETDDEVDSSDGPAHELEQTTSRETTNSRGTSHSANPREALTSANLRRFSSISRTVETTGSHVTNASGFKISTKPEIDFKPGTVIAIPRPNSENASVAAFSAASRGGTQQVPKMRLVVLRTDDQGTAEFTALVISTYNGQGVGFHGVVKADHVVIYTGTSEPDILLSERPRRLQNGSIEGALRVPSIHVRQHRPDVKLDTLSRLNLRSVYRMKHSTPFATIGYVEGDSLVALVNYRWQVSQPPQLLVENQPPPTPPSRYRQTAPETYGVGQVSSSSGRHPPHASGRRSDDEIAPVIAAYESARRSQHESINAAVQSSSSRVRNDAPMGGRSGLTNFATELATLVSEAQRLSVRGPELKRDEQRRLAGDRTAWANYVRNLRRNWGTELASRRNNKEQSDDEESDQGSTEDSSDSD